MRGAYMKMNFDNKIPWAMHCNGPGGFQLQKTLVHPYKHRGAFSAGRYSYDGFAWASPL